MCEGDNIYGPTFLCPPNTICSEDSTDVCEHTVNYIDPALRGILKCQRNERIADPTVPGCKGYILCIPNKNKYQAIKFKCTGNTIFNGATRTCSSPERYKCPLPNITFDRTQVTERRPDFFIERDREIYNTPSIQRNRPIDCKNYKFSVRQDNGPVSRVTYFCPKRSVNGRTQCTIFSNHFCLTLQRDDEDQFAMSTGLARRKPRADFTLQLY